MDRAKMMLQRVVGVAKLSMMTQKEDAGKRRLQIIVREAEELLEVLELSQ